MIDTNTINQVLADGHQLGAAAQTVHDQITTNWPAICAGALWLRTELKNVSEYIISHGGLGLIAKKLLWNPGVPPVADK